MKTKILFLILFVITITFCCNAQTVVLDGGCRFIPPSSDSYAYFSGSGNYWEWDFRSSSQYRGAITNIYRLDADYINATNFIHISDESVSYNIQPLNTALPVIMKLEPVTFDYNLDYSKVTNKKLKSKLISDEKDRIGFIAQEVQKVLPQSVNINEADSMLGIQMTDFIPLLVKGMQEQTALLDSLKTAINEFTESQNILKNATLPGSASKINPGAILYQNNPNPFKESTIIYCDIPSNVLEAKLMLFDIKGTLVKTYGITGRSKTSVYVSGTDLNPGIYIYSLLTDGKEIDSQRMVRTN